MIGKVKKKLFEIKHPRSGEWSTVRKKHLKEHGVCEACGGTKGLEVHHVDPYHLNPEKELDPDNLITLCEANKSITCHRCIGHLGNYKRSNPDVKRDAKYIRNMLKKSEENGTEN